MRAGLGSTLGWGLKAVAVLAVVAPWGDVGAGDWHGPAAYAGVDGAGQCDDGGGGAAGDVGAGGGDVCWDGDRVLSGWVGTDLRRLASSR